MIRIATTVLAVFLAVTAFADSYHPHILNSEVVTLDVAAIERYAQSGTPFELSLGKLSLKIALSPAPVWPADGLTVITVGKGGSITKSVMQGNITYAGEVEGEDPETSEARFTIAEGALEGYVLSTTGSWFLEPLSRFSPKADASQYLVYATRDLDFVMPFGDDGLNDEIYDPSATPSDPTWQIPVDEPWQIPIVMVADREYYLASGVAFYARHASLINMINGIYRRETGREFRIRISVGDTDGWFLTNTEPYQLRTQLKWFIAHVGNAMGAPISQPHVGLINNLRSRVAHLTTGKELVGNRYGVSEDAGHFSLSQQVRLPYSNGTVLLNVQRKMLAAHELGHHFNGTHADAEKICVDWDLWWCDDYERTLMWEEYLSDNRPEFSAKNRKNVRDKMTAEQFAPHP